MQKQNERGEESRRKRKTQHFFASFRRAFVFSLVAMGVFFSIGNAMAAIEGAFEYEFIGENALLTKYRGGVGPVNIPATLGGRPVTIIGEKVFEGKPVTSITVPSSVEKISRGAFMNCFSVKSITIPDSVNEIGAGAFRFCTSLTSMTLPKNLTNIEEAMFDGCTALTSVDIPASVRYIYPNAFLNCSALLSVEIPASIIFISYSGFAGCSSLASVTLPDGLTKLYPTLFSGCTSLTNLTIPASVTTIEERALACADGASFLFNGDVPTSVHSLAFGNISSTVYRKTGTTGWGDTLAGRPVKTWNNPLTTPTLLSPEDAVTELILTPTLTATAFESSDTSVTHVYSQWQVDVTNDFSNPVWDSGKEYAPSSSVAVPEGQLDVHTTYHWRVRYQDSEYTWSEWSDSHFFKTYRLTPTITAWPTATDIFFGQSIDAAELIGGEASVPGSFGFDAPETQPNEGTSAYAMTFTPTDGDSYKRVPGGSVDVTVKRAAMVWVDDDFTATDAGWGVTQFATIQDGVNVVAENGGVNVAAGEYVEHVVIDKALTLQGDGAETTIIDGNLSYIIVTIVADNVVMRGFTVTGSGSTLDEDVGVFLNGITNCMVENCTISNNGGSGIELCFANDNIIRDNIIENNAAAGILLMGSADNTIERNVISGNTTAGVEHRDNPDVAEDDDLLVMASANYWGAEDGPSGDGYLGSGDAVVGAFEIISYYADAELNTLYYFPVGLSFSVEPVDAIFGTTLDTVTVQVMAANNEVATQFTNSVTLSLDSNPSAGVLSGTLTVPCMEGRASFTNLVITGEIGTGFTLKAEALSLIATSAAFDVFQKNVGMLEIATIEPVTYTAEAHAPEPIVLDGGTTLMLNADYTLSYAANTNAGVAAVTVSGIGNYTGAEELSFMIKKAAPTLSVKGYKVTYNGKSHTAGGTATGVKGEELEGLDLSATRHTGAGTYANDPWSFTDVTGNYDDQSGALDNTISKAMALIVITVYNDFYTGNAQGLSGTAMSADDVTDLSELLNMGKKFTNVPGGPADWSFAGDANHLSASGTQTVTIRKAPATVTVYGYQATYDGKSSTAAGEARGVKGEALAGLDLSGTKHKKAGTYWDDPWTFTDPTGNYYDEIGTVASIINKAHAKITIKPYKGAYDGEWHGPSLKARGANGRNLRYLLDLNPFESLFKNVPGGNAKWTFLGDNNHYAENGMAAVTIKPASAIIVVFPSIGTYTGTPHGLTTASAFGKDQTFLIFGKFTYGEKFTDVPGGRATWTFSGEANYKAKSGSRQIDILPKKLIVTPNVDQVKIFGVQDPVFAYKASGMIEGENPEFTGQLKRSVGEAVGTYSLTAGDLKLINTITLKAKNYKLSFKKGTTFKILPKSVLGLTVDAIGALVYNGVAQTPSPTVRDGTVTLIEGQDYMLAYAANKNVGAATLTVTGMGNYTGTKNRSFTIEAQPLVVTADAQSKECDGEVFALADYTVTVDGFVGGEDETALAGALRFTGAAIEAVEVGDYVITPEGLTSKNYAITFVDGVLAITQVTPTVSTWPVASKILTDQTLGHAVLSRGVANVPGTFAFDDPTMFPTLGTANYALAFTPEDQARFKRVNTSVAVTAVVADRSLPEALDNDVLVWTTGGDANWVGQTVVTSDGVDAATSGMVTNNSLSWLETTVTHSGTLSFAWNVSCKHRSSKLIFFVDGVAKARISGEPGWQSYDIAVGSGTHTFRWVYGAGKVGYDGQDRGWVDQVVWTPEPPGN